DKYGSACNYAIAGQNLGGKQNQGSLPNQITYYKRTLPPFSHSLAATNGCRAMTFTANLPPVTCGAANYSVSNVLWDFGDPASGSLNSSASETPLHIFTSSGTFSVKVIYYYR